MTRSEWLKTPYAKSDTRDPDGSIERLLAKYAVRDIMTLSFTAPSGRPGYGVRFVLKGRCYKAVLETLDAQAGDDELRLQVKRAVFFLLKSLLEASSVFAPPEQVLFAFLESPAGGATMYDAAQPYLQQLTAPDFARIMLPAHQQGTGTA